MSFTDPDRKLTLPVTNEINLGPDWRAGLREGARADDRGKKGPIREVTQ